MDSDSDWDSLSGDGPVLDDPPSVAGKSQGIKASPMTPAIGQSNKPTKQQTYDHFSTGVSPSHAKTQPANATVTSSAKTTPRIAEQYRNTNRTQGVTVFRDSGNIDDLSTPRDAIGDRGVIGSQADHSFDEVELQDKSEYEARKSKTKSKKKQNLQENLPYTNFEAQDHNQNKITDEFKREPRIIKTEYIRRTPETKNQSQRTASPWDEHDAKPIKNSSQLSPRYNPRPPAPSARQDQPAVRESRGYWRTAGQRKQGSDGREHHIHLEESMDETGGEDTDKDVSWNHGTIARKGNFKQDTNHQMTKNKNILERIYYEKSSNHYYTLEIQSSAMLPGIAQMAETYTRRGWQEIFGALQILLDFFIIFAVELMKFLFRQFARKFLGGIIEGFSDHVMKPLLAVLYNGILQPLFTFLWNLTNGVRNLLNPMLLILREIISQLAMLLGSLRLVEVNTNYRSSKLIEAI